MNTKTEIKLENVNMRELSPFMQELLGLMKRNAKQVRGIFKAGIRENVKFESMKVNAQYNALDLKFRNEENTLNYTRVYAPKKEFYRCNEEGFDRAYKNKVRLVYALLNTATYPNIYDPRLIDIEEWDTLIREIAKAFNKETKGEGVFVAGVWTINKNGYVGLRQSFRNDICTMAELEDYGIRAKNYFVIDRNYDHFEVPSIIKDEVGTPIVINGSKEYGRYSSFE